MSLQHSNIQSLLTPAQDRDSTEGELQTMRRTRDGHLSDQLLQEGKLDDYDVQQEQARRQEQGKQRLHALRSQSEAVRLSRSCAFATLPTDVIGVVCRDLSKADIHSLSQSCRFFYQATHKIYDNRFKRLSFEVISAMARGKFNDKIKRLLTETPRLLMGKAKVKDLAGHYITGPEGEGITPYQLALASGIIEWVEFMNPLFENLRDGETKRQRQIQAQLPHGWVDDMTSIICTDDYIDKIVKAIIAATPEEVAAESEYNPAVPEGEKSSLRLALDDFRQKLTSNREVQAGKIVNHQNLLKVLEHFKTRFFDLANREKRDLYCNQIIGYLQRDESALAKKFAIGIVNLPAKKIDWDGTFNFTFNRDDISYFYYAEGVDGFPYWFDFHYGRHLKGVLQAQPPLDTLDWLAENIEDFLTQTQNELAVLSNHRQQCCTLGM